MTYISFSCPEDAEAYYNKNYVFDGPNKYKQFLWKGYTVQFYKDTFFHAFFDNDKMQKKSVFSDRRASRLPVINDFLLGSNVTEYYDVLSKNIVYHLHSADCLLVFSIDKTNKKMKFITLFTMIKSEIKSRIKNGRWIKK